MQKLDSFPLVNLGMMQTDRRDGKAAFSRKTKQNVSTLAGKMVNGMESSHGCIGQFTPLYQNKLFRNNDYQNFSTFECTTNEHSIP